MALLASGMPANADCLDNLRLKLEGRQVKDHVLLQDPDFMRCFGRKQLQAAAPPERSAK
jgi:hypothetical protein